MPDAMLLATLDHIDQGVGLFGSDLRLVACNQRFCELFRVTPDLCAVGTPLGDLLAFKAKRGEFGPVDLEQLARPLTRPLQYERPSGDRAFHERFQPIDGGLLVVATDVSAPRQLAIVEDKLRRQSKFPEENPMPVLRFGPDGRLSYANRASGPLLARVDLRVGGLPPDTWQSWFVDARAAGHPTEQAFDRDGAYYSLLLCPVVDTGDVNVYGRDLTERVRHEQQLQEAKEAADQANRTKSQFLANMSHELRTPMNAIMGFTRLVMRKSKDVLAEKQYANLEKILVSAEHLLSLINDILDLSKIEAGRMELHPERFELAPLVELCLKTVEPMAAPGVTLSAEVPPDLPALFTDQPKLKQVLINLLSNAVKFTRSGSVRVVARFSGDRVAMEVIDTGVGIPPEMIDKVFDEFQQVDGSSTREFGGTGLGLAICRRLAELLGGTITLTSEVGVGSTFTLEVAARSGEARAVPAIASAPAAHAAGPERRPGALILAIDDDADAAYLVKENLTEAGYEVAVATSGADGIARARALRPSAITLDVKMADMDGWQVLHRLKSDPQTRDIPVILLTVVDEKPLAYRLGATDYLLKPFDRTSFLTSLRRIMRGRGNLLVVDDDPNVHDLACQILEGEPVEIRFASNGAEALAAVEAQVPDAIFLDLMMPVMDGFAVIDALHAHPVHSRIPIVVFTAKILTDEEKRLLAERVSTVVEKRGLDREALLRELRGAMERAQGVEP